MISIEELSRILRESDDSLDTILCEQDLNLKTALELKSETSEKTTCQRNRHYVYPKKRCFYVRKTVSVDGVRVVRRYGGYKTQNEADAIVDELEKCNWDKNKLGEIQRKLDIYQYTTKKSSQTGYYKVYKRNGYFCFKDLKSKSINGLHKLMDENGYVLKRCPKRNK